MTHTPGPWLWRDKSGTLHAAPPEGTQYKYGATVLAPNYEYDSGVDTIVSDDDARLIAAAPDLLALAQYAVDNPEFDSEEFDRMARAAIKKATGQ